MLRNYSCIHGEGWRNSLHSSYELSEPWQWPSHDDSTVNSVTDQY